MFYAFSIFRIFLAFNPWLLLSAFLLLLLVTAIVFVFIRTKEYKYSLALEKEKYQSLAKFENKRLSKIFEGAELGVAVFKTDGKLQMIDKEFNILLDDQSIPDNIDDFLEKYGSNGSNNDLKANFILGNKEGSTELKVNNKTIKLRYSRLSYEDYDIGVVVFARDVSSEIEEDEQRKKFVANVSHELKTPITVMKIYAETLLDWGLEEKPKDAIKKDINNILDNANRMESLVNDLLLLSRIDSKGRNLDLQEIDVVTILQPIVDQCQFQAKEKNISLNLEILSKTPPVLLDRNSISKVFSNLILNAIKYTEKGGKVDVYVSRVINDIVIKVKDNGLGIAEKELEHIFERFYRVDKTGSREFGGTGLGLSIVKEFVDLHHGKISINSVLTYGSEFVVSLPMAAKFYLQVMQDVSNIMDKKRFFENKDIFYKNSYNVLLNKASELDLQVEELEDLTSDARRYLMEPYINETRKFNKNIVDDFKNEDFADVLSKDYQSSSYASFSKERQDKSARLDKREDFKDSIDILENYDKHTVLDENLKVKDLKNEKNNANLESFGEFDFDDFNEMENEEFKKNTLKSFANSAAMVTNETDTQINIGNNVDLAKEQVVLDIVDESKQDSHLEPRNRNKDDFEQSINLDNLDNININNTLNKNSTLGELEINSQSNLEDGTEFVFKLSPEKTSEDKTDIIKAIFNEDRRQFDENSGQNDK